MHHYCQRDCSDRLPSRYYLPFSSTREDELTGRTFFLEQTCLQGTPKDCNGHWVTWLNAGLQIKESEILMVAWNKENINELIRRWEVKRSHESRCWIHGNTRKCAVQKEEEGCMDESKLAEFEQESCLTSLFRMGRGQEKGIVVQHPPWQYCVCISEWEQEVVVEVWHIIKGQLSINSSEGWGGGGGEVTICHDGMDEWMGCKLPCALQQHPLPTLHASCLGQGEERDIRARPQRRFAFPLLLFTWYFCMTLIMKLKTLVQLQAAILGSIASSPDTEITIFQASN